MSNNYHKISHAIMEYTERATGCAEEIADIATVAMVTGKNSYFKFFAPSHNISSFPLLILKTTLTEAWERIFSLLSLGLKK